MIDALPYTVVLHCIRLYYIGTCRDIVFRFKRLVASSPNPQTERREGAELQSVVHGVCWKVRRRVKVFAPMDSTVERGAIGVAVTEGEAQGSRRTFRGTCPRCRCR